MNFRRYYVPHAIVFITQVIEWRTPVFRETRWVDLLLATLRNVKKRHSFTMLGYVILPDHLHLLIKPAPPETHSTVMQSFKSNFTHAYKEATAIPDGLKLWQKRFFDHVIRDEEDFERHLHYIHYNPVKHGLVARPENWPSSSFREWKARGAYADCWGWSLDDSLRWITGSETATWE